MKKPRILVVEDDRIIARSLRLILEQLGYEVTALASTGQAAIREAEETKPDLILMDIVLDGDMDGIEAARVIRSHLIHPDNLLDGPCGPCHARTIGCYPAFRLPFKTHYEGRFAPYCGAGSIDAPRVNGRRMRIVSLPGEASSLTEDRLMGDPAIGGAPST